MTHYCPECCVNWAPYMTGGGACPECGGGTKRRRDNMDPDAADRHRAALRARADRERREHARAEFEAYYAQREAARLTEDVCRDLAALPVIVPAYGPRRAV